MIGVSRQKDERPCGFHEFGQSSRVVSALIRLGCVSLELEYAVHTVRPKLSQGALKILPHSNGGDGAFSFPSGDDGIGFGRQAERQIFNEALPAVYPYSDICFYDSIVLELNPSRQIAGRHPG